MTLEGQGRLRCGQCPGEFDTESQLEAHERFTHQQIAGFRCLACNQEFDTSRLLEEHERAAH